MIAVQQEPMVQAPVRITGQHPVILITGSIGSGKTTFLAQLYRGIARQWKTAGFISQGCFRKSGPNQPSDQYQISLLGQDTRWVWAERNAETLRYDFNLEIGERLSASIRDDLEKGSSDIYILDEIGHLEVNGSGFADLFRTIMTAQKSVICAARKSLIPQIIETFDLQQPIVIDLDETDPRRANRMVCQQLRKRDADKVGVFAAMSGGIEIGLGSMLHAWRVPFKGYILASIQNVLLIFFGKELNGRGLIRISLVTAMLKSFSPAGARLRPMLWIFIQGLVFALPVMVFRWHFISAVSGSILMGWLTLLISLASDYAKFGRSVFDAYVSGTNAIFSRIGLDNIGFWYLIACIFIFKAVLSIGIAIGSFYFDFSRHILRSSPVGQVETTQTRPSAPLTLASSMLAALRDLMNPRFLIPFVGTTLLIFFFTELTALSFATVIVRGGVISWFGFLLVRRIDITRLTSWLTRKGQDDLAQSFRTALQKITGSNKNSDKD